MIIETKETKIDFKPVELKITFETAEELDSFKAMCQINKNVSNYVADNQQFKATFFDKTVLKYLLNNIFYKLKWSEDL